MGNEDSFHLSQEEEEEGSGSGLGQGQRGSSASLWDNSSRHRHFNVKIEKVKSASVYIWIFNEVSSFWSYGLFLVNNSDFEFTFYVCAMKLKGTGGLAPAQKETTWSPSLPPRMGSPVSSWKAQQKGDWAELFWILVMAWEKNSLFPQQAFA